MVGEGSSGASKPETPTPMSRNLRSALISASMRRLAAISIWSGEPTASGKVTWRVKVVKSERRSLSLTVRPWSSRRWREFATSRLRRATNSWRASGSPVSDTRVVSELMDLVSR